MLKKYSSILFLPKYNLKVFSNYEVYKNLFAEKNIFFS